MKLLHFCIITLSACWATGLDKEAFYSNFYRDGMLARNSSERCNIQINETLRGLYNAEKWALEMLDSSGSIPVAILRGNTLDLGFFDECLEISHEFDDDVLIGKYCLSGLIIPLSNSTASTSAANANAISQNLANAGIPSLNPRENTEVEIPEYVTTSVCIPDACSPTDIFSYLGYDTYCTTRHDYKQWDGGDIAFTIMSGIIVVCMALSTAYDVYLEKSTKKKPHPLLVAFSLYTNGRKIINVSHTGQISCLNGIKVLSMFWVVMGHRFSMQQVIGIVDTLDTYEWMKRWYSFYVLMAPLAVDTFLFVSGILLSNSFLKTMRKPKARFNLLMYYVHRYLRLTPALGALWFFQITIIRRLGSGPMWIRIVETYKERCVKRWWQIFLYIQNYFDYNDMRFFDPVLLFVILLTTIRVALALFWYFWFGCLLHTWYLSIDMQVFIISPLLLIPILKWPKLMKYAGMPFVIFLSILCPLLIIYLYDLEFWTTDYYQYYYYVTHTRLAPWLMGITFGAYILEKDKYHISGALNITGWSVMFAVLAALFLSQNHVVNNHERLRTTFYMDLQRPVWALCLGWICFACIYGYGGIINWFLSLPVFQVLSKLTYSVYLVHVSILVLSASSQRTLYAFNDFQSMYLVFADIVLSFGLGTIWTLCFESPVMAIERYVFGGGRAKTTKLKTDSGNNMTENVAGSEHKIAIPEDGKEAEDARTQT